MTVIEAEPATRAATPQMDAILAPLREPVWTLVRAGQTSAAVVLIAAKAREYYRAWREEEVGLPAAVEVGEVVPALGSVELASTEVTETGGLVHVVTGARTSRIRSRKVS